MLGNFSFHKNSAIPSPELLERLDFESFLDSDKEQMFELLEFIGLAEHAEIPAAELSGGQRRLLALGRAIAMRPKMLFSWPNGDLVG